MKSWKGFPWRVILTWLYPAVRLFSSLNPLFTADIEQILIRGVHGPGELHAILVEEACLP